MKNFVLRLAFLVMLVMSFNSCQKENLPSPPSSLVVSDITIAPLPIQTMSRLQLISTMKSDLVTQQFVNAARTFYLSIRTLDTEAQMKPYAEKFKLSSLLFYNKYKNLKLRTDARDIINTALNPSNMTGGSSVDPCVAALGLDNADCEDTFLTEIALCTIFTGWTAVGYVACLVTSSAHTAVCYKSAKRRYDVCKKHLQAGVYYDTAVAELRLSPSRTVQPLVTPK